MLGKLLKGAHKYTVCTSLGDCQTTNLPHEECIFPFIVSGKTFNHCKQGEGKNKNKFWCATSLDAKGYYRHWGWCTNNCPTKTITGTSLFF